MKEISSYQIETVKRKILKGIVKMELRGREIDYDTKGLRPVDRISFCKLIQMIKIVKRADEFFFYRNRFVFEKNKVFQNKKGEIYLLYLPVKDYEGRMSSPENLIRRSARYTLLQENLLAFYGAEEDSYLLFNKKKLIYIISAVIAASACSILIHVLCLLGIFPLIVLPLMLSNENRTVKGGDAVEKTMLLSRRDRINVCFSDVFGNEKELNICEHENKYIGRDEKACALHIHNNAVGRKHAKITYANGKLLLADNDSLNKTYINEKKLKEKQSYEVRDGDRIRFANEEFMIFIKDKKKKA